MFLSGLSVCLSDCCLQRGKKNKGNKHCCTSSSDIFQNRPKDLLLWTRIFDELKITRRDTASTGSQVERSNRNTWESHFGFDSLRAEDAVFDEIDNLDAQHNKFCFCTLFSGCGGKMTNIQNQLFHLFIYFCILEASSSDFWFCTFFGFDFVLLLLFHFSTLFRMERSARLWAGLFCSCHFLVTPCVAPVSRPCAAGCVETVWSFCSRCRCHCCHCRHCSCCCCHCLFLPSLFALSHWIFFVKIAVFCLCAERSQLLLCFLLLLFFHFIYFFIF